jgi:hypothetical protein
MEWNKLSTKLFNFQPASGYFVMDGYWILEKTAALNAL